MMRKLGLTLLLSIGMIGGSLHEVGAEADSDSGSVPRAIDLPSETAKCSCRSGCWKR
ncbi:hypothetical protein [Paenibacillus methanolicus]|uniref:Uncharacterized protein n=1 Tax=Paenibacillus methanolicus TaxID=582686 RepID=A0A5S5CHC2_9BACL|nr:hypothetical protein [Paenibacillus methanolicus]TYP79160.1 hypothetical protein BCM02_101276 [Paenibacillus methanolicus]